MIESAPQSKDKSTFPKYSSLSLLRLFTKSWALTKIKPDDAGKAYELPASTQLESTPSRDELGAGCFETTMSSR